MVFEKIQDMGHENVVFCHDSETGLRAIIAIHDTTLGSALGGTRRWFYENEQAALTDVLRLSQAMTWKAAAADLPMGGAKSVIMRSSKDEQPTEALARAMGRMVDRLNGLYIAAEDVGVNTQFIDWMAQETNHVMGGETVSRGGDPAPYTARGVVNGIKAGLQAAGKPGSLEGVRIAIQGLGALGYNVLKIAKNEGADVVAAEMSTERLEQAAGEFQFETVRLDEILTVECDVLCPCALGAVVNSDNIPKLNCKVLSSGANNVLANGAEDAKALRERGVIYCPDFVVNGGGLIRLAGLYVGWDEEKINSQIRNIEQVTLAILNQTDKHGDAHTAAIAYAEERIRAGKKSGNLQTA
ncbi:MAG: Glu/Leu/Phe/Val dehydrogenase dimerization domain-containing protein [Phycisphaerales bacterium]